MKREFLLHTLSFVLFFVLVSLIRGWLEPAYLTFWLGGVLGTLLPDVDHLIYVYFLKPYELTSQRVNSMLQRKDLAGTLDLLYETRSERTKLVFHTVYFQIIFLGLTFLVLTSSGGLFARGLVLAFAFHLSIDQSVDLYINKDLGTWFRGLPESYNLKKATLFTTAIFLIIFFFALFL